MPTSIARNPPMTAQLALSCAGGTETQPRFRPAPRAQDGGVRAVLEGIVIPRRARSSCVGEGPVEPPRNFEENTRPCLVERFRT